MEILLFFVMNNKIDRDDPIVQIALYEYFMAKSADLIPEGIAVLARDGRIFSGSAIRYNHGSLQTAQQTVFNAFAAAFAFQGGYPKISEVCEYRIVVTENTAGYPEIKRYDYPPL